MSDEKNTTPSVDPSTEIFNLAVAANMVGAEKRADFDAFEKATVTAMYKALGLTDIPDQYLTFTEMNKAFSTTLLKSIQAETAIKKLKELITAIRDENAELKKELSVVKLVDNMKNPLEAPIASAEK